MGPVVPPHVSPLAVPGPSSLFEGYAATGNARSAAQVLDQILARYPTDPSTSSLSARQEIAESGWAVVSAGIP